MALLVALSALAEQAAGRSFLVRYFVLWILRRAEAVVARFVLEATGAPAPAIAGMSAAGNGRADALLLAARLKALATAVGAILRWALILQPRSGGRWRGRSPRRRGATLRPGRLALTPDGLTAGPNDTS